MSNSISPQIPASAPFSGEQISWLNGFLAALISSATVDTGQTPETVTAPKKELLILYGSQSGNTESFAKAIGKKAKGAGFNARVAGLETLSPEALMKESYLLLATSTWGEGEMPDNAKDFWDALSSEDAPKLKHLHYSVLALGDTNYETFCQAGKDFDLRLAELGAVRIHPRSDCDADYEDMAEKWLGGTLSALQELEGPASTPDPTPSKNGAIHIAEPSTAAAASGFDRKNPFPSRLLVNKSLSASGSNKDVRHFEFSLEGSGLSYEVGDALGVMPRNCPSLVDKMLTVLKASGEEAVPTPDGDSKALREALIHDYEITKITTKFLKLAAECSQDAKLNRLLEPSNKKALEEYLWGRDPLDILEAFPAVQGSLEAFLASLKKLSHRLYSIASSSKAHPDTVHLTVSAVRYETEGRERGGVCSTFMADRLPSDETAGVFVQKSNSFRLPLDSTTPIIMVGPGTGIAPFRGFLQERAITGSKGKNWLFFGDQHAATDFLYQDELTAFQNDGVLQRLDTAFSRDQREKLYVQHLMLQNGKELWAWLQEGAHFYVCGDASRMAKDVDATLHQIAETAGGKSPEEAISYIKQLKSEKRYQRDVY